MSAACDDWVSFIDGELLPEPADEFREHLRVCEACGRNVVDGVVLVVRLSELKPRPVVKRRPGAAPGMLVICVAFVIALEIACAVARWLSL